MKQQFQPHFMSYFHQLASVKGTLANKIKMENSNEIILNPNKFSVNKGPGQNPYISFRLTSGKIHINKGGAEIMKAKLGDKLLLKVEHEELFVSIKQDDGQKLKQNENGSFGINNFGFVREIIAMFEVKYKDKEGRKLGGIKYTITEEFPGQDWFRLAENPRLIFEHEPTNQ
jgi:hypothetical protein